jgi:hypothetical protein
LVPLFSVESFEVEGKPGASLKYLATKESFKRLFFEKVGAEVSDCLLIDVGPSRNGMFLGLPIGKRIWMAYVPQQDDEQESFADRLKAASRRGGIQAKNERRELCVSFPSDCMIESIRDCSRFILGLIEGQFTSGECKELKENFDVFFRELERLMSSRDYECFAETPGTLKEEKMLEIGNRIEDFRNRFTALFQIFSRLWAANFDRAEYVLREEFEESMEMIMDEVQEGGSVGEKVKELEEKISELTDSVSRLEEENQRLREELGRKSKDEETKAELEQLRAKNQELERQIAGIVSFMQSQEHRVQQFNTDVRATQERINKDRNDYAQARAGVAAAYAACGKKQ